MCALPWLLVLKCAGYFLQKRTQFVHKTRMDPTRIRQEFMDQVGNLDQMLPLLDSLADTAFFFKDKQKRLIMVNARMLASCGVATEAETIGKVGYEFFPTDKMAIYLKQDDEVMRTGKAIINAICPAPEPGSNSLIVYSKIPLRDNQGIVIGLAGVFREQEGVDSLPSSYGRLARVIENMHQRYAEPLKVKQLAEWAHLSPSQLTRQFRQLFGVTPHDYLTHVRVNAAARLLRETEQKTTEIALQCGFFDHSHFSRTFKKLMGATPRAYRLEHAY